MGCWHGSKALDHNEDFKRPGKVMVHHQDSYYDKNFIKETWDKLRPNLRRHSVNFFLRFDSKYPYYTNLFLEHEDLQRSSLPAGIHFQSHHYSVLLAIDKCVELFEFPDKVIERLMRIGAMHASVLIDRRDLEILFCELIDYFKEELGSIWNDDIKDSWKRFMEAMLDITDLEMKKIRKLKFI